MEGSEPRASVRLVLAGRPRLGGADGRLHVPENFRASFLQRDPVNAGWLAVKVAAPQL
jgi:hypothetical protein